MRIWKFLALVFFCAPALAACGNGKDAATIYVLTPPQKAARFTEYLAAVSRRHGLSPNLGQSTDDKGYTFHVLEAKGRGMRLWATNMPLSGGEDVLKCGKYSEGHPDPGQYAVTINYSFRWLGLNSAFGRMPKDGAKVLMSEVNADLEKDGYDVRQKPIECSPLSKARSSG